MSKLNTKEAFIISSDIKDWQTKYKDVENLPIEFYLKYTKEVLAFFHKISEDNQDGSEFVNEIMDLIEGYCRPDFRVW